MGTMTFQLPPGLDPEAVGELERACLAGGPDSMPAPTSLDLADSALKLTRDDDDSCYLVAPWTVPAAGTLAGSSATLMARDLPYDLLIEIVRGKVNQVRNQAAEWQMGGLQMPDGLAARIKDAAVGFGRAVCGGPAEAHHRAGQVLESAYGLAADLAGLYRDQVFHIRRQRSPRIETALAGRLDDSVFGDAAGASFAAAFNRAVVPLSWHTIESEETTYDWSRADALLDWAEAHELDVSVGPLVDFSAASLPAWLWLWERDVPSMATFMCRFVEAAVRRYRSRVRRWQLSAGSNWAAILGLTEEELLGLTYRLGEAARSVDPALELVVGLTQPWGEYRIPFERASPFQFADNLIRSGLQLGGLDLEVVMGVNSRGSYVRDALDLSRLLDLYALLGVPLSVTLGYPAAAGTDPDGDPELTPGAGVWRAGYDPASQADWVRELTALALCKPYVRGVQWCHFADALPHTFPHCGLLGPDGSARPALAELTKLRETYLK
ncbi:MAG: endo-1,4-beta-xylanase [Gemmataceae bacterium]